jgi:DNA phosphorothioation system restriction enzyme
MSLRELGLKRRYRSNEDDLLADFYAPCLAEAASYRRAAGYFSSAVLDLATGALEKFVARGGHMNLVVSRELRRDDYLHAQAGYAERVRLVNETLTGRLRTHALDAVLRPQLGLLGWLIARGRLNIRIAVLGEGREEGIYHEKFGIFEDARGDRVAFHGSANESRGGFRANFESLIVFRSWRVEDREDLDAFEHEFAALWSDQTPNLDTYDFPDAARDQLIRLAQTSAISKTHVSLDKPEIAVTPANASDRVPLPAMPATLELRDYQRQALSAWLGARGRGILEMATGTGKTVTALVAYERLCRALSQQGIGLMAIVVCPYQHLVDQWAETVRRFGVEPILCYQSRAAWASQLGDAIRAVRQGVIGTSIAIATNATFQGEYFRSLIADCPTSSLLIADEAHNLGAPGLREALPERFAYRLALSATPERAYDHEGTTALSEYFGDVVYRFGLAEAIGTGALTPYHYAVSIVELEGAELDAYLALTRRIARAVGADDLEGPSAQALLIARARIIANARQKISALADAISPYLDTSHNLIYCGDGSSQDDTGDTGARQIEAVVRLLGRDLGMRVQPYTAETPTDTRRELRARFVTGDLQALVAIRCLDEGVDIPETERAFILASSTNPRQYVQRRGRVLRPSPQTGKRSAYINDFLAVPPQDSLDSRLWETERRLVRRELERVLAFAELASNGPVAVDTLADLRQRYGLLHL